MPALIDPTRCNLNWKQCFSARMCPEHAFSFDEVEGVKIDSTSCGKCHGPCINFCDGYAILYDRNPQTFEIMRRQVIDGISEDEALAERRKLEKSEAEARTAASSVLELSSDSFASEVLEAELPVIVDFWAPWCGPCKAMAPVFEALAIEYDTQARFAKLNTEDYPGVAAQYRITSIPTLLVFHGGQLVDGAIGALPEEQLRAMVERVLTAIGDSAPSVDERSETV